MVTQSPVGDSVVRELFPQHAEHSKKNVLDSKRVNEMLLSDCTSLQALPIVIKPFFLAPVNSCVIIHMDWPQVKTSEEL